jgi:hypothetical protein
MAGLTFFLLLAACAETDSEAPSYAGTMRSGCAPHDAPSTELHLRSEETGALVLFNLWPPSGISLPATVVFDAQQTVGQGAYCASDDECQAATSGRVTLAASDAGGVLGSWLLVLEDGSFQRGRFTAEWLASQALCG